MSRETLLLLQTCLKAQQLQVGAPDFIVVAEATSLALVELEEALNNL